MESAIEVIVADEGLTLLGWRTVPVVADDVGPSALAVMPAFRQLFVSDPAGAAGIDLDRRPTAPASASSTRCRAATASGSTPPVVRTLVYKACSRPASSAVLPDLADERFASALALVHSRFSTNTFPSWPLAHPYRYLAHNGEINTVRQPQLDAGPGPLRRT